MNYDAVEELMGVSAPWIIHDIRINKTYQRAEICIGMARSGWFGARRAVQGFAGHHKVWRHVNMGQLRCTVRVDFPEGGVLPGAPWAGDVQAPFTHAMGQRIMKMLAEGIPLGSIGRLMDLDADMLWQFKRGIDTGKLGGDYDKVAVTAKPEVVSELDPENDLPAADCSIWHDLLSGDKDLEMRNLGLRLMLMKLRQQYSSARDDEVRMLKAQQLRTYFEKNQASASHEIEQIRGALQ
ncbi:hypothetical protein [Oceanobacter mangrovi]|uniref:hypothetical protein n=1 Tax=Oceanobacter mangrovi TaxID=2862510 RepID=UPI001C8F0DF4|nr:hypothetical protein [Oceanobacter mangrovi]